VVPTPRHAGRNTRSRGHLTALGAVVFDHNGGGDAGHRAEQRVCWTHDAAWLFQGGMGRRQKVMHKMLIDALTLHKKVVLAHLVPQGRLSTPSTSQKSSHTLSHSSVVSSPRRTPPALPPPAGTLGAVREQTVVHQSEQAVNAHTAPANTTWACAKSPGLGTQHSAWAWASSARPRTRTRTRAPPAPSERVHAGRGRLTRSWHRCRSRGAPASAPARSPRPSEAKGTATEEPHAFSAAGGREV
jgi:hypothetical protein